MNRPLCALSLLLSFSGALHAAGISGAFSPVPLWPPDGVIPETLYDRYVFRDPAAGQIVLVYPENLGTAEFERDPGEQRLHRIDISTQVAPSLSVTVQRKAANFEYAYRVANSIQARQ